MPQRVTVCQLPVIPPLPSPFHVSVCSLIVSRFNHSSDSPLSPVTPGSQARPPFSGDGRLALFCWRSEKVVNFSSLPVVRVMARLGKSWKSLVNLRESCYQLFPVWCQSFGKFLSRFPILFEPIVPVTVVRDSHRMAVGNGRVHRTRSPEK